MGKKKKSNLKKMLLYCSYLYRWPGQEHSVLVISLYLHWPLIDKFVIDDVMIYGYGYFGLCGPLFQFCS